MNPDREPDPLPRTAGISRLRVLRFPSLEAKAHWLDAAASMDTSLLYVRDFCRHAWAGRAWTSAALAQAIQRFVRDRIHYVRDPGHEEFADAEVMLQRRYGDCDDKARLFVALCRLAPVRIEARIRPVFRAHPFYDFVHVQAEARYPGSERDHRAAPGGWLLAEVIVAGVELGDDPLEKGARGPDGKLVYA